MNFSKKDYTVIFLYILLVFVQLYVIDLLGISGNTELSIRLVLILANAFIVLYAYKDVLSTDWSTFRQHKWTKWIIIVAVFIIITCSINFIRSLTGNLPNEAVASETMAQAEESDSIKNLSLLTFVLSLVMIFVPVLSSVTEEVMFRYVFMFKHSQVKVIRLVLLLLSSILFGIIHYKARGNIEATVPYIFTGFVLGTLYLWKKNIWYNILVHMMFNGINVLLALFGILYQRFLE